MQKIIKKDEKEFLLRIKTIDNKIHEVLVKNNTKIIELKEKIKSKLEINTLEQRLIFQGKVLENTETLEKYKINQENTLILIAQSIKESDNDSNSEEPQIIDDNTLQSANNQQDMGIINNILRSLSENSLNRRNYRRKLMQQRTFGFMVNEKESLEVISQNLNTTKILLDSKRENGFPFDFKDRKFKLGQWLDVKDTIEQWLEAEVIDIDEVENKVFVHYNGWGRRWDEWITMNSPRLAIFRTHTVQNGYSMYLSPVPVSTLDGDSTRLTQPKRNVDDILDQLIKQLDQASTMLKRLKDLNKFNKQEEERKKNFTKKEIDVLKVKKKGDILRKKKKKKTLKQFDNFSMKMPENFGQSIKIDDEEVEAMSMKSLRPKKHKNLISKKRFEMSPTSLKSNNSNLIQEEEIQEIIEEENSISSNYIQAKNQEIITKLRNREITQLAQQVSPLMDRLGRSLTDFSPHIAMKGADLRNITNLLNLNGLSMATLDGSVQSNAHIGLFDRFQNNNNTQTGTFTQTNINSNFLSQINNTPVNNSNIVNKLVSTRPLVFQIPVMLNPGEILSIGNNTNRLMGEGYVDLHIHAVVRSSSGKKFNFGTQTDPLNLNEDVKYSKSSNLKIKKSKDIIIEEEEDEDDYF